MSQLYVPAPYQQIATDWIVERPACALWMDCGLRKTSSTLAAMVALMDRVEFAYGLVVGTPRIAEKVWRLEVEKWQPFNHLRTYCLTAEDLPTVRVDVIRKGQPVKVAKLANPRQLKARIYRLAREHDFLTIHYDLLPRLVKLFGDDWLWDLLVLDESSMVKNHDTDRFKAVRRIRGHVDRMVQLTGTPNPNGLEQLWSQVFLLDGGRRLGRTLTEFRDKFMEPDARSRDRVFSWRPRPGKAEEIYALVGDICMSMSSEDWQQLPPRIDNRIPVFLPPSAMERYRLLERDYLVALESSTVIEAPNAAALRTKLRQMASGAVYDADRVTHILHTAKLDALEELVETTAGPVLLAYEFQHEREQIKKRFKDKAVALDERADWEEAWNAGDIPLGIMHPQQGGHGLNIQEGGSVACWYSPPVDFELYYQFNKRLHRSGATADRIVINQLVAQGTVDEDSLLMQTQKGIGHDELKAAVKHRATR
jgi:SNF2 family DNA or RNA helicase